MRSGKKFLDDNFLLQTKEAEVLYHEYAKSMPIIDYHNHLPPQELANDIGFRNITHAWLAGDHYKWRAMRANGIDESYCTGDKDDRSKFKKWAETVPYTMRNPLYHWTHLELQRYFGITDLLDGDSADSIYDQTTEMLQSEDFKVRGLLSKMNVKTLCTTDDPLDTLEYHEQIMKAPFEIDVFPAFRPDKFILIGADKFLEYVKRLAEITNIDINTFPRLLEAIESRMDFFAGLGCRVSDHGLEQIYAADYTNAEVEKAFASRLSGESIGPEEAEKFMSAMLHELGVRYAQKGWRQQFHVGAFRNVNKRAVRELGPDTGWDSIGDFKQAVAMGKYLGKLDEFDNLAQTIIYNLNPADNEIFASMIGNFNDGTTAGKVQWGSSWWFLDQKDGMEKQMNTLSNMGLLSKFVGMLTDSRSFLSFPRHEYFRRILCNLFGNDIHNGELPNDEKWIGKIIQDICYNNAADYFGFKK